MTDADRALQGILDAWNDSGPVPWYHDREKARLKRDWPTLWMAIQRAADDAKAL